MPVPNEDYVPRCLGPGLSLLGCPAQWTVSVVVGDGEERGERRGGEGVARGGWHVSARRGGLKARGVCAMLAVVKESASKYLV
jgi:hypothetical protein